MDVLAQFQLSYHRPWWRPAQSSHKHLHRSRLLRSHFFCHLQHGSEKRKTGHGTLANPACLKISNFRNIFSFFLWITHSTGLTQQVHVQNATLAGAVAMGTAAEFMITPYGSLIVGFCMGIISVFGYLFITVSLHSFFLVFLLSVDGELQKRKEFVLNRKLATF